MGIIRKKKLISMLLMIMILAVNLVLVHIIQSVTLTATFSMASLVESYRSYSEDLTVQETVYQEEPSGDFWQVDEEEQRDQDEQNDEDEQETQANLEKAYEAVLLPEAAQEPIRIVFLGDCMMADNMARALDKQGMEYTLEDFHWLLDQADLIVANLETSIGTSRVLMDKAFQFQSDPVYMSLFEPYREKTVFSLANNHGMDGPLSETMENLDKLDYAYIGVGKNIAHAYAPHVVEINGVTLAIFAASQVMPTAAWRADLDKPGMAEAYNAEKLIDYITPWIGQVDYTVAYIHWGEELANHPTYNQRVLEEALRSAGINLIIGSHPHVLQAVEWHDIKQFTAHSLGNFVFTTSHTSIANETAALELMVTSEEIQEARLHFGRIEHGKVHQLANSPERRRIISRMNGLSKSVFVDDDGWLVFNRKEEQYELRTGNMGF